MKSSVPLRALSRTNLADTSRHSSPNSRPVSLLQPLVPLQKSQLLCHSSKSSLSLAQSAFCEESQTPGVGHISTSASRFVSAVTCITWRLYPLWPQSIAHTSRHHGGVPLCELLRCTEAEKCLSVSPLFATLTHSPSRKSFPCHSYENTGMGVRRHFRATLSAVTCATWRLYPLRPQSIAHTFRHHRGVLLPASDLCPMPPSSRTVTMNFMNTKALGLALLCSLPVAAAAQTADEILAKVIVARGGRDKLHSIHSERVSGRIAFGEVRGPFIVELQRPLKMHMQLTIQNMTMVRVYDGKSAGWANNPFAGKMNPDPLSEDE